MEAAGVMFIRPTRGFESRRRAKKRRTTKAVELEHMRRARSRDEHCRFALCGCQKPLPGKWLIWFKPEVAHLEHRGMGGNSAGDRSEPSKLITVCNWRHKLGTYSLDKKTLQCVPLTDAGTDGPVQWEIPVSLLVEQFGAEQVISDWRISPAQEQWAVLAVEREPHVYERFTDAQLAILTYLARMDV